MSDAELKLLNGVELRFALANTDAKLQKLLSIYLCPVLLKLDSNHVDVRSKVHQIIAMLDGRLRESQNISLPFDALLAQYKNNALSSSLKGVTLALLKTAQERSQVTSSTLSQLFDGIHSAEQDQQQVLFQLVFRILKDIRVPSSPNEVKAFVGEHAITDVNDQICASKVFCKLMLLHLGAFAIRRAAQFDAARPPSLPSAPAETAIRVRAALIALGSADGTASPLQGISQSDADFLAPQGAKTFTVATLNQTKLGVLQFLSVDVMPARLRFPVALLGSFDLDPKVQQLATDIIRRKCDVDWEDAALVEFVYDMLSWGQSRSGQDETMTGTDLCQIKRPLSTPIRIKLLQLLSKSKVAVASSDQALAVMLDGFQAKQAKLTQATVGFVHWFARTAELDGLQQLTRPILIHLTNHLNTTEESESSRGFAYIAVGLLASRDVQFTQQNPDLIGHLFASLGRAKPDVRLAIEEALSSCINTFRFASSDALYELRKILLNVVVNAPPHTHATAVRFALNSFSFSDVGARFICLLAARNGSKPEIQQEARRGLDPHQFRLFNRMNDLSLLPSKEQQEADQHRYDLPNFADLVTWPVQNLVHGEILDLSTLEELSQDVAESYISFTRRILVFELLQKEQALAIDENWATKIDNAIENDVEARSIISSALKCCGSDMSASLARFEKLVVHFCLQGSKAAVSTALELLVLGSNIKEPLGQELAAIRDLSLGAASELQSQYCKMRALISVELGDTEIHAEITRALEILQKPSESFSKRYGTLMFLPFFTLRLKLAGKSLVSTEVVSLIQESMISGLDERDSRLCEASLDGLAQLALLGLPAKVDLTILQKLIGKSTDPRIKEAAVVALGFISLGFKESDKELKDLIKFLLAQQDSNAIDLYIATGEALAIAFGGFDTSIVRIKLALYPEATVPSIGRDALFAEALDEILSVHIRSPKKLCRKAACLWLLTLVQVLKHSSVFEARLKPIHKAFMSLMADQDEFVTESASQGIQLVYKQSDQSTKDELVSSLMGTFASDSAAKAAAGNIGMSSESELFAPGTLSVGDNNNVSTYKDICDLAVDMGNNELVYQFMSLASSASIWSTRRGSALGLSSILASSGGSSILANNPALLKRLVPRLYRYKHDPSKTVAKTMNDIFAQICPDEKVALKEQFDEIMRELLKGLTDRAWRTREASCNALVGLLLGRNMNDLEQYTEQLWQTSFRVLDDVKESVRVAALGLCKSLTKLVLKGVSGDGSSGKTMLDAALPIFLRNLKSPSLEVSSFSLETLLKLVKASGRAIQPYLATLVEEFMLLTTNMEPEMLNYLSFHAAKYNVTQSQLDEARLASMRSNPIMSALEDCVDQLSEESAPETISRLCSIIRQTNGLPTKAACARFIISSCSRKPHLMKREADALIQALSGSLNDASETTRTAYAASVGYLARLCDPNKLLKLVAFLSKSFFKASEQDLTDALPLVLSAVSQNALDRFQSLATSLVPIVFLGLHEQDERIKGLFKSSWERCTTSKAAAVRLYLPEILVLCETHLVSPVWRVKQLAARALADAANDANLADVDFERIFTLVVQALTGRSWNGKEQVLQALVALTKGRAETLSNEKLELTNAALLKEFRRTSADYKRHALSAMAIYLKAMPRANIFDEVAATVVPFLMQTSGKDADGDDEMVDLDDVNEKDKGPLRLVVVQSCIACLLGAVRPGTASQVEQLEVCANVLEHVFKQNYPWNVTLQIPESITDLYKKIQGQSTIQLEEVGFRLWNIVAEVAVDQSYMTLRENAVKCAGVMLSTASNERNDGLRSHILAQAAKLKAQETNPAIQTAWATLQSE
ncbi:proteasome stabiliser-domain-containing protein [Protomyces lactucae-debilis]|uniref:Proteasome stabiliser-domain-containing protein n=1 Tax=Protomyces lactucae-debilis TaxID=2754530 RepID=A0A1Y2FWM4_PROLT|nr:proteasome stabiliser-domain-containing protein [Protomyces lactucae-debilis]ORY87576.1 proteasome stabiliser-domain-containing protein [Protomyces lactucae-debilis]